MKKLKLQLKNKYLPRWGFWLFVVICLALIVYIDSLEVGFLEKFFDRFSFWNFFNKNAGAVQALSTVILILITAFYAFQTRKTNELMSMQVFPNIFIKPDKLYSSLLESEFTTKVKEYISASEVCKTGYNFNFSLNYSVLNHSASPGSIERPQLLIENPQTEKKKYLLPDTREVVIDSSCKGEIKNTIYLRAGEVKNIEEEYCFFVPCGKPLDDDMDLINNASFLKYTILYKNVVGNQFSVPLAKDNILPLSDK